MILLEEYLIFQGGRELIYTVYSPDILCSCQIYYIQVSNIDVPVKLCTFKLLIQMVVFYLKKIAFNKSFGSVICSNCTISLNGLFAELGIKIIKYLKGW